MRLTCEGARSNHHSGRLTPSRDILVLSVFDSGLARRGLAMNFKFRVLVCSRGHVFIFLFVVFVGRAFGAIPYDKYKLST